MGSVQDVTGTRIRLIFAVMAILFIAVVACLITTLSGKEVQHPNINWKIQLNASTLSQLFQTVSRPFAYFAAMKPSEEGLKPIEWEEQPLTNENIQLCPMNKKVFIEQSGTYLVFAQATFKLPTGNRTNLRLQVNQHYTEKEKDDVLAVMDSRDGAEIERDAVLILPVLLYITKGNSISVWAEPLELIDYGLRPASSFLIILKLADG